MDDDSLLMLNEFVSAIYEEKRVQTERRATLSDEEYLEVVMPKVDMSDSARDNWRRIHLANRQANQHSQEKQIGRKIRKHRRALIPYLLDGPVTPEELQSAESRYQHELRMKERRKVIDFVKSAHKMTEKGAFDSDPVMQVVRENFAQIASMEPTEEDFIRVADDIKEKLNVATRQIHERFNVGQNGRSSTSPNEA